MCATRIFKQKRAANTPLSWHSHIRLGERPSRGVQQTGQVVLAVLENQKHHFPPSTHHHVQETNAARVRNPLEELDLSKRRQGEPVLFLVMKDHLFFVILFLQKCNQG